MKPFFTFGRGTHRWRWILVGAYAAAWLAASVVRGHGAAPSAPPGTFVLELPAVHGASRVTRTVLLAYRDYSGAATGATPVVLLHGSPGNAAVFDRLAGYLHQRRVIVPDLPGFGASSHDLPDYSFHAHAIYIADLLRHLGLMKVHVLGFSMGGGVALTLADIQSSRVASVTLLSAIGVQEMELLGDYHVNHAVHGAQLGALWLLRTLLPHTGWLDGPLPYARNFYDSDQRPLRGILRRLEPPVLIVHGRRDPLVPVETAAEHARLVPQSELHLLDQNHFMLFEDTEVVAPPVLAFLERVDHGVAPTRATAEAARVMLADTPFDFRDVPLMRRLNVAILAALTTTSAVAGWAIVLATSYRRRRLLLSSWRRVTRWEYWPLWAVYPPVALWIAWLGVKYRCATLFAAANPAIPGGGVAGESKFAILCGLGQPAAWIARSGLIAETLTPPARIAAADAFMTTHALSLPIVLKPDKGERGAGVQVVRCRAELEEYLERVARDTIIQEYVPGVECGVFYARRPSTTRGAIVSMTVKRLPVVVGDGRRTLEALILDDPRAVCMARFHLAAQRSRLATVPTAGMAVSLGDCGSHCRGAEFLDGRRWLTPALEDAVEVVAGRFKGFYFGRFDVRAASYEALSRGEFTVIELNGVTSEPTHIYDPAVSIVDAYRALFEQWSLAFEIGAANARAGAPVTSVRSLVRTTVNALRQTRLGAASL